MKVGIKMRIRGRQRAHKEIGVDLMNRFVKELAPPPKMLGDRDLNIFATPLPKNKRGKNPRGSPEQPPASNAAHHDVGDAQASA
jgi:hypothetical protein